MSTAGNAYDRDYFGDSTGLAAAVRKQQEFKDGEEWDMPILNVFRRGRGGIYHFWGCELLYVPPEPGQEYRHNDLLDPVWNMFDLAPEGRGDFQPKLDYTSPVRQMMRKEAKGQAMAKNTICLWYDKDAEAAARFYAETFPGSAVGAVLRAPSDYPSGKEGDV